MLLFLLMSVVENISIKQSKKKTQTRPITLITILLIKHFLLLLLIIEKKFLRVVYLSVETQLLHPGSTKVNHIFLYTHNDSENLTTKKNQEKFST